MRHIPIVLSLVLVAGCGSSTAGPSDSGIADARSDAGSPPPDARPADAPTPDAAPRAIERLDWRQTRGAPLATRTATLDGGDVVAAHRDGFVVARGCELEVGCDYEWHDLEGKTLLRRSDLLAVNGRVASPDGRRLLLLARQAIEACGDGESRPLVATGELELLDIASGAPLFVQELRTNLLLESAFSTTGAWFQINAVPSGACRSEEQTFRAAAPPFEALASAGLWLESELAGDRWLAWRGGELLVRAGDGSLLSLGEAPANVRIGGGWVHAHHGFSLYTSEIRGASPEGAIYSAPMTGPDLLWRARDAWGRWGLVCALDVTAGDSRADCVAVDVTGAHPARWFVMLLAGRPTSAFIGRGRALLFESPGPRFELLDLETGGRQVVLDDGGELSFLGDGDAALLRASGDGSVLLVEAERQERLVAGGVEQVLALPGPVGAARVTRQHAGAVIVESLGLDAHRLMVFDLTTRRLAALSDRLYFAPHQDSAFGHDDCGQPRATRSAGAPIDALIQDARRYFFVETPVAGETGYSLWTLPVDLSAPPRRLLASMHPIYCHSPLTSPDGALTVVDIDGFDGTTSITTGVEE